jgi:hypothetical protein
MDAADLKADSFVAAGGTLAAYALVIIGMTILLFGVPYLLFTFF